MEAGSKEYFSEVRRELNGIKEHAQPDEIHRLNFRIFDPTKSDKCIFGLMTGYSFSFRANEIISKIGIRFYKQDKRIEKENYNPAIIEGTPDMPNMSRSFYTLTEHCIVKYPHNNERIIAFLKGETKFVDLKG